jgi:hypothetical protein
MAARLATGIACALLLVGTSGTAAAQTPPPRPTPFPTVGGAKPPAEPAEQTAPDTGALGVPVYPAAIFLETIDAGRGGQQYHLFGTDAPYSEIVAYYKNVLRDGGRTLFQAPAMHQFELGRFQEQSMAYPPSVVVKDYSWNGGQGYLHVEGTTSRRFPTVIQIVPPQGR